MHSGQVLDTSFNIHQHFIGLYFNTLFVCGYGYLLQVGGKVVKMTISKTSPY
ncbi:MAG: hypothetical protein ABI415_07985 [Flavitalea sp.]